MIWRPLWNGSLIVWSFAATPISGKTRNTFVRGAKTLTLLSRYLGLKRLDPLDRPLGEWSAIRK